MIQFNVYRNFFFLALFLHGLLATLLLWDNTHDRPVMTLESKNEPGVQTMPQQAKNVSEPQAIQAVSVDAHEVMNAVNQLKAERERAARAEENRQRALASQAEAARRQRLAEQQRLERLKQEAAALALAQKKKMEEEQQRLQQLAKQKEAEKKQLQALQDQQREVQKQQQAEQQKLAQLRAKQAEEKERQAKIEEAKAHEAARVADALAKQKAAEQAAAAAQQAAQDNAAKQARIAGVVDKYKALIIHAIGQQWILPEHVDSRLSSQFRIRLAPNGTVLEVSLIRSSGDPVLDRSAQSAIYKASPLPVPSDTDTFNLFRDISLTVRPENIQG